MGGGPVACFMFGSISPRSLCFEYKICVCVFFVFNGIKSTRPATVLLLLVVAVVAVVGWGIRGMMLAFGQNALLLFMMTSCDDGLFS